jgi:hypothetical protein
MTLSTRVRVAMSVSGSPSMTRRSASWARLDAAFAVAQPAYLGGHGGGGGEGIGGRHAATDEVRDGFGEYAVWFAGVDAAVCAGYQPDPRMVQCGDLLIAGLGGQAR